MVTRSTWAPPHMAVGYGPGCSTRQGLYPCFPIMSRFGLTGLGRGGGGGARGGGGGSRGGRGDGGGGPVFVGSGPSHPQLGGRRFGRGFRFPSRFGPYFSDGNWGGAWPWGCPWWQLPSYPLLPQYGAMSGLGIVNPVVPRYGLSDLSTGLFCWPPIGDPNCSWGLPEVAIILGGLYTLFALVYTTGRGAKKGYLKLETKAQRRRKTKAAKYRARAKALEAKGLGGIFA